MSSITINKIEQLNYREGFDVTVKMVADDKRERYKTFFAPGTIEPTAQSLKLKLDKFIADHNILPVEEKIFTEMEINEILKEKKYFTNEDKFPDDLPVKEDI